ncbi:unnamed protein product, partial [Symbiodinium necroappetens]
MPSGLSSLAGVGLVWLCCECVSQFASICPLPLAHQLASASRLAKALRIPRLPLNSVHSMRYRFRERGHINVQELR